MREYEAVSIIYMIAIFLLVSFLWYSHFPLNYLVEKFFSSFVLIAVFYFFFTSLEDLLNVK